MPEPGGSEAAAAPDDEALLFRLFNEIGIINQLATNAFERVMPHDLTIAQFAILNHCARLGDNKTPAQLADILQVTRGTLTSTLGRLSDKRFIRLVPDEEDGRSKRVVLTAAGRRARDAAIAAAMPILSRARDAMPRARVQDLLPALEDLRRWLDADRAG
ncbi:MAG: MarR family winged helix-turn-helix transcriptional regulator [Alphaproteobacteria bacterium]